MTQLRLLTLNTWGGRVCQPLLDMVRRLASEGAEVLCFQEVYDTREPLPGEIAARLKVRPDLLTLLRGALPGYEARFTANVRGLVFSGGVIPHVGAEYGNAIFVRGDVPIEDYRAYPIVSRAYETKIRGRSLALYWHNAQVVRVRLGDHRRIQIANYHGIPFPPEKLDTPIRLLQSQRILQAMPDVDVLCGDFNLHPSTTSIAMLETRWRDLIREFNVETTRSHLNPYHRTPQEQRYADYVFVRDSIAVNSFRALDDQVSDHLGLWLDACVSPG